MFRKASFIAACLVFLILPLVTLACAPPTPINQSDVAYADPIVENMLQAMNQEDYAKFSADFDDEMKKAIPESAFKDLETLIKTKIGDYETGSKKYMRAELKSGYIVVYYAADYTNETVAVVVTTSFRDVGGKNLVGGFFLSSPKLAAK